ncbi:MAG: hypothetical protein HQL73_09550 [Magnetococcales bacterium]|nr:hypothetical protein [Magnetococcales bacterium]
MPIFISFSQTVYRPLNLGGMMHKIIGTVALIGAGLGVGASDIHLQIAFGENQARVPELERQAVARNDVLDSTFQTKAGSQVPVTPEVEHVPSMPAHSASVKFTVCRNVETTDNIGGQAEKSGKQYWCRTNAGDWKPVDY